MKEKKRQYPFNLVSDYFYEYNNISESDEYEIFDIDARKLFLPQRIDLVVKYFYIQAVIENKNIELAKDIYCKHIEAFSDGTFSEMGDPNKNSMEKYISAFNNLIESFKKDGYDCNKSIIPIGKNNELIDGSHRVACAAFFNQKIRVIKFSKISINYDYKYFKRRFLKEDYLELMAEKYCEIKENTFVACVWPKAYGKNNKKLIEQVFKDSHCQTVYYTKKKLDYEEFWNLIFEFYKQEPWIGHKLNGFKGITNKTNMCYSNNRIVQIYVIQCTSYKSFTLAKEEIRRLINLEKSSIHTTDNKEESVSCLRYIFNKNPLFQEEKLCITHKKTCTNYLGKKARHIYTLLLINLKKLIRRPV